jgi:hypothetical protein
MHGILHRRLDLVSIASKRMVCTATRVVGTGEANGHCVFQRNFLLTRAGGRSSSADR